MESMNDLYAEALLTFRELLDEARVCGDPEPTAMTLASCDNDGRVSARTVLLKAFDERGFVFYTNTDSLKGRQLGEHAECALLAGVTYEDGSRGLMLAFVGASPDAEPALAKAVSESLVFSGLEPGALDVAFPTAPGALAAIGEVGRRFEMPAPEPEPAQVVGARAAPGMDPAKPPKLR